MSTITVGTSAKIMRAHLERLAVVYVRQSTLAQVRDHGESTQRQYALTDDAERLGWPAEQVLVIDADLGMSGRGGSARTGFKDLVGRVCCGEVGVVFGLEVSRLARSSADLQRLLELCSLTDTLIIDGDGVYDLGLFNDRLLLGLKGTMSEAELHLLAGRLQGARRAAAERGELRFPLPVGYVYDDEGQIASGPRRGSPRRGRGRVRVLRADRLGLRGRRRVRRPAVPGAPTAARGPGSCATAA
jgi:DNA invertase Pin-like site-specific DNA recombinase